MAWSTVETMILYDSVSAGVGGVALWLVLRRWFDVPGVGVFVLVCVGMVVLSYVCVEVEKSKRV